MSELSFRRTFGRKEVLSFLNTLVARGWDAVVIDTFRTVPAAVGADSSELGPTTAAAWTYLMCGDSVSEEAIAMLLSFAKEYNH